MAVKLSIFIKKFWDKSLPQKHLKPASKISNNEHRRRNVKGKSLRYSLLDIRYSKFCIDALSALEVNFKPT